MDYYGILKEYDAVLGGLNVAGQKPGVTYQQLSAAQKTAIGTLLNAYGLPANHAPQIHQMLQGYMQQLLQQTA